MKTEKRGGCPYFEDIVVTQQDVVEIQLAKGAIRTGIEILLKDAGLKPADIGEVITADIGVKQVLISEEMKSKAEQLAKNVKYLELTAYPDFSKHFAHSLRFQRQNKVKIFQIGLTTKKSRDRLYT